ncbi:MAG: SUMF1/EgtB/PvdO family nonheme iron enzyme [Flavobacteriales bacterium]|nr:SUMF1/EgtB/PvdO family nonheme iron enzyme [Flavobacteriales bacterium]MCB9198675.1 SUMF1/EgtB/PvdO family nonheme iron enzyme [Flavobacteriales bacterium]
MKHDYPPFQKTDVYRGLYELSEEEKDDYKAWFKRAVPFTYKNYWTVLNLARGYYVYALSDGEQFVTLPGGSYTLGEKGHQFNPEHTVEIASFKISRYEVTNWQFAEFVSATGYITLAEKNKDAMVFRLGLEEFEWVEDTTANWQFPNGFSGGSIRDKADHPVTCISYIDAKAYCEWAKVRLPTVDEWEVASKGSGDGRYFFGEDAKAIYEYANVWHGKTHLTVDPEEDFLLTAPVGSKAPNLYGIYDIYGNVFEFCEDQPATYSAYQNVAVTRGGSWWCSLYACSFFNSIDLGRVNQYASFSNNGFRVVKG